MLLAAFLGATLGAPSPLFDVPPSRRKVVECSPRLGADYRERMRQKFDYLAIDHDERGHSGDAREDLQALTFASGSIDAVLCAHVLEHVPDHRRALAELLRVLRPGGLLCLSVPIKRARTVVPPKPTFHADQTLVHREFGLLDLIADLDATGFELEIAVLPGLLAAAGAADLAWMEGLGQDDCAPQEKFGAAGEVLKAVAPRLRAVCSAEQAQTWAIGPITYHEVFLCRPSTRFARSG